MNFMHKIFNLFLKISLKLFYLILNYIKVRNFILYNRYFLY